MNKMRPIHPGEVLQEEFLDPLGPSAHALAQALRVPAPRCGIRVHDEFFFLRNAIAESIRDAAKEVG